MGTKEAIEIFRTIRENNAQIDIFGENRRTLMQIYKHYDTKTWNPKIDFGNADGSVLELLFYKGKKDNTENKKRFLSSNFHEKFDRVDDAKEDSYFYFIPDSENLSEVSKFIDLILDTVYGVGIEKDIQVNIY